MLLPWGMHIHLSAPKKISYSLSLSTQFCFIFTDSYAKQYLKLTNFWGFYASHKSSITLHWCPFCCSSTENFHHQGEEAPPSPCGPPRNLNIPSAGPALEPRLVISCFLSFISFFVFSSHPFTQNPLPHPYTVGQRLTHQLPCQVCDLLLELVRFCRLWLLLFLSIVSIYESWVLPPP